MTTFLQFVRPAIVRMRSEIDLTLPLFETTCRPSLGSPRGALNFSAVSCTGSPTAPGQFAPAAPGIRGAQFDERRKLFYRAAEERGSVEPGETVQVQPFALFD